MQRIKIKYRLIIQQTLKIANHKFNIILLINQFIYYKQFVLINYE